jgi:hypothetical protein
VRERDRQRKRDYNKNINLEAMASLDYGRPCKPTSLVHWEERFINLPINITKKLKPKHKNQRIHYLIKKSATCNYLYLFFLKACMQT